MFHLILIALPLISANPGYYSYHAQRIGNHPGFEHEMSYGTLQNSIPRFYRSGPFPSYKRSLFNVGSGLTKKIPSDLVGEVRSQARTITSTLKGLAANPRSAARVNQIIADNYSPCLNSIEEGIASIQSATQLVEDIGPDVQAVMDKLDSFEKLSEPSVVVRETGALLRLYKPLAEKTGVLSTNEDCKVGSLRSLAVLTSELADRPDINLGVREKLRRSSAGISSVTTYLTKLQASSAKLENFCTADNKYNRQSIAAIGELMEDLADLYGALGDAKTGERIRYGKVYTDKVTAELTKLDTVGLGASDCSQHGDISAAAQTLEDLATLIDEVGIENLQQQLGTDIQFDFDFETSAAPTFKRFKY